MSNVGAGLRWAKVGGTQSVGVNGRWRGVAIAGAVATLFACTHPQSSVPHGSSERMDAAIAAGLDLYESREYGLAARRFEDAGQEARKLRRPEIEKRALTAQCTSWLLAHRNDELGRCSDRLEQMHRRANRSEPGIGTLLALGAIADDRPAPPFRVAPEVAPLLRATRAAGEGR
jgi:hypothetical protein